MDATDSSTSLSFEVAAFNASIIVGPVVLGTLVDTCLFGCLVIQTYVYYANFANDHRAIKFTVAAVFATQIAHVMCVSATLWNTAVSAYDDPSKLQILPLAAAATILFTGITGALVEVRFLVEIDSDTHLHLVVLCFSTMEGVEKTSSSLSLPGALCNSSGCLPCDHGASFQNNKRCDVRN
ncbi:uncharacterized protein BJ212DRAFT_1358074 [Suillus subaureus]|uniref:Uncharacterized protein n=1 Tax=Suillus subaureus TaxID=48587 RepID=A0A9P7EA21_9AGAM|nr:uncharacterized protein BJ212DRAFT_1358074 [Suillus subaureus]KAG1815696.1 hypothetical protein BJ212DRAFT_1358074 [Suillus subaureus]